jgi:hypothetical protein
MRCSRLACFAVMLAVPAFASAQSVPIKYLPPDTEVVVSVNFQQMLGSKVAKDHKEVVDQLRFFVENKLTEVGAMRYLEKAGLDLFKDITSVAAAGPGKNLDGNDGVAVAEGKFNPEKLQAAAEDAAQDNPGAINITKIDNQRVYEVPLPDGKTVYIGTVGTSALLASPSKAVFTATMSQLKSGKAPELPKAVQSLLQTTSPQQSLSIVATGPALARIVQNAPIPNDQAIGILKGIDGLSLAFTLNQDISFQLGITAGNKEKAEELTNALNGGLFFVRNIAAQKAKEDPKLAPAVEVAQTLRVVAQGNNVVLRGEVSYETLGKILKNAKK